MDSRTVLAMRKRGYVSWSELTQDDRSKLLDCPKSNQPTEQQQKNNEPLFRPSYAKGKRQMGPSFFAGFAF